MKSVLRTTYVSFVAEKDSNPGLELAQLKGQHNLKALKFTDFVRF